jgi:hypothetical protein
LSARRPRAGWSRRSSGGAIEDTGDLGQTSGLFLPRPAQGASPAVVIGCRPGDQLLAQGLAVGERLFRLPFVPQSLLLAFDRGPDRRSDRRVGLFGLGRLVCGQGLAVAG